MVCFVDPFIQYDLLPMRTLPFIYLRHLFCSGCNHCTAAGGHLSLQYKYVSTSGTCFADWSCRFSCEGSLVSLYEILKFLSNFWISSSAINSTSRADYCCHKDVTAFECNMNTDYGKNEDHYCKYSLVWPYKTQITMVFLHWKTSIKGKWEAAVSKAQNTVCEQKVK